LTGLKPAKTGLSKPTIKPSKFELAVCVVLTNFRRQNFGTRKSQYNYIQVNKIKYNSNKFIRQPKEQTVQPIQHTKMSNWKSKKKESAHTFYL
jgi:hypothetical protein